MARKIAMELLNMLASYNLDTMIRDKAYICKTKNLEIFLSGLLTRAEIQFISLVATKVLLMVTKTFLMVITS